MVDKKRTPQTVLEGVCLRGFLGVPDGDFLVIEVVGVGGAAEHGEPVGDIVLDVAHVVEEGAEAVFRDFALVDGEGFDLVVPGADGAVDGEVLRLAVVVEEVPVVLGCLDVEFHLLVSFVHVDLASDGDRDAQGFVADAHQADFSFAEETEGGIMTTS